MSQGKATAGEGEEEEGEEGRTSKGLAKTMKVSREDREDHNRTHTPYRSWCKYCVRARGKNMAHRKGKKDEEESTVPRISMDYFYMSQTDEEATDNPILVAVNESSGEKYARAAGQKGIGSEGKQQWLIKGLCEEMRTWGHQGGAGGKVILKCDGEKAMTTFRDAVGKFHGGEVIPEQSANNESQPTGIVEEAGGTVRGFARLFKDQIEDLAGLKLEAEDAILQLLIRWAAMNPSRFLVGQDGKTGIERRRGRKCKIPVVPFGEKVWYKKIREGKSQEDKMEIEWEEGLWLGHNRNSNEVLVGTKEGVVKAYALKRMEEDKRWDPHLIKSMRGTPQQPDPTKASRSIPIRVKFDAADNVEPDESAPAIKEGNPRHFLLFNGEQ